MRALLRPLGPLDFQSEDALNVWQHIAYADYIDNFLSPEKEYADAQEEALLYWHEQCAQSMLSEDDYEDELSEWESPEVTSEDSSG